MGTGAGTLLALTLPFLQARSGPAMWLTNNLADKWDEIVSARLEQSLIWFGLVFYVPQALVVCPSNL